MKEISASEKLWAATDKLRAALIVASLMWGTFPSLLLDWLLPTAI